jgi:hypothetical protein
LAGNALVQGVSRSFSVYTLGDFNGDGVVDSADINALYGHFSYALNFTYRLYDLNGDGTVDQADVDYLVKTTLQTGYGDSNLDHAVGFLDFQVLQNHWQNTGAGWAGCDFNGDGVTDFLDFQTMLNNWNPAGVWDSSEEASATASSSGVVQGPAVSGDVLQTAAASMAVSTVHASGGYLSPNLLTPAATALTPAPSGLNSQSIQVADLLATRTASNASVYVPTGKARVLSRRSGLTDGSWTSDDGKVDLLTQLIRPVT